MSPFLLPPAASNVNSACWSCELACAGTSHEPCTLPSLPPSAATIFAGGLTEKQRGWQSLHCTMHALLGLSDFAPVLASWNIG